jgi:hypothetical protein
MRYSFVSKVIAAVYTLSALCYSQKAASFDPGSGNFAEGVYTNDYFGLAYKLGDGWYLNKELMDTDSHKEVHASGMYLLFVADRHIGTPERVVAYADDVRSYPHPLTPKDYANKVLRALVNRPGMQLVREAYPVEYVGRNFFRADYRENYASGSLWKAFVCTELRGFSLSWTFVATSEEALNDLTNSLGQLSVHSARPASK